jgi:hypothetical protein
MASRLNELLRRLRDIESRLIRVESRIVQLMNHVGIKPKGVIPENQRKERQ